MPTSSVYPERFCLACGVRLVPRQYPGGRYESPSAVAQRKYCSHRCAQRQPGRPLLPNPDRPGTLLVPLTQGQHAIIDAEDGPRVAPYAWCAARDTNGWYAVGNPQGRSIKLHRFLLAPPPGVLVDHLDRNPLNCTRANMRLATAKQNAANRRAWSASGYRGVHAIGTKWQARARHNGRLHFLGLFADPAEAARAVDAFWREVGDEHTYLNFPDES